MSLDVNTLKAFMSRSAVIVSKHHPGYQGVLAGDALRFELGWHRDPTLLQAAQVRFHRHHDVLHARPDCWELRIKGTGGPRPGGGYAAPQHRPTLAHNVDFATFEQLNNQLAAKVGERRQGRPEAASPGLCASCCKGTVLLDAWRASDPAVWPAVAVELAASLLERGAKAARTRSSTVRAKALNHLSQAATVIEMLDGGTLLPGRLPEHVTDLKARLVEIDAAASQKVAESADSDLEDLTAKLRKQMELGDTPVDETPIACAIPTAAIRTSGELFQTARANWRVAGNDRGEILVAPCWAWTWIVTKIGSGYRMPDPTLVVVAGRDWLSAPGAWDTVMSLWDPASAGPLASLAGAIDAAAVLQREPV